LTRRVNCTVFAVVLVLGAMGCSSYGSSTTGPAPAKCQVSLSTSMSVVEPAGGTGTVKVNTQEECAWSATAETGWIALASSSSGQGSGAVTVSIAENPDPVARRGAITVNGQRLDIDQGAAPCRFAIAPRSQTIAAAGGAGTVGVGATRGCSWTASSSASWITITGGSSGSGDGTVSYQVAPTTGPTRTATLSVAGEVFSVTQLAAGSAAPIAPDCTYQIQNPAVTVPAAGGPGSLTVTSTASCSWIATTPTAWITITSGASGIGDGMVRFTAQANTGAARSGTITVGGQTATITQPAAAAQQGTCSYTIGGASQSIAAAGGPGSVAVSTQTSCSWTATSNAAWITGVTPNGTATGTVRFTVAANTGSARSGTITIAGQTFTINQAAAAPAPCTYAINPVAQSIAGAGGGGSVAVTAGPSCAWTAISNASWITVTTASGTGNGTANFVVAANPGAARSGTITIAGQTFTVNQASSCTYAINPAAQSVIAGGALGTVDVTTGPSCTWTATSNVAWIIVTTTSGTGNGSVGIAVATNTGAGRTGTATIAGQTFTITQASGCTFSLSPASAQTVPSGAASYDVTVTASGPACGWTAAVQPGSSWLTLTPTSGTGSGKVTFSVSKNKGADRSGVFTIAGQTFTVTQRGD
jgi:hypothetical protein